MRTRDVGPHALLLFLGTVGAAAGASAQPAGDPKPETPSSQADAPATETDLEARYAELLYAGVQATVRRDSVAAMEVLRDAAALLPERPEAYCRMGDAQRVAGALVEAVLAYESCSRFADAAEDTAQGDLGRAGQAVTLERIPGRTDEARAVYSRLLTDSRQEAVVALAEARIRAMDDRVKIDTKYAPVRQRIAERERKLSRSR